MKNELNVKEIVHLQDSDRMFMVISTPWEDNSNTVASMVMLGQIDIYQLDRPIAKGLVKYADKVEKPTTVFGACPAYFAIEI